jgi:hypothetical protein
MKWGVRHDRYAKYRKNKDKYVRTNKVLNAMEKTKKDSPEYGKLKRKIKSAAAYDRGRATNGKGIGIDDITRPRKTRRAIEGSLASAAFLLTPTNMVNLKWNGKHIASVPMNMLATGVVAAGSAILEATIGSAESKKIRDLRTYYSGGPSLNGISGSSMKKQQLEDELRDRNRR